MSTNETRRPIVLTLVAIFLLNVGFFGQKPNWIDLVRSVRPLNDNRKSVRARFGEPILVEKNRDFFNLSSGKLVAVYSFGECSPRDLLGRWRVPEDTLLTLDLEVRGAVVFSSLNLDLKGFRKKIPTDTPDLTLFTNKRRGIEYTRFQKYLSDVSIFPSELEFSRRCND